MLSGNLGWQSFAGRSGALRQSLEFLWSERTVSSGLLFLPPPLSHHDGTYSFELPDGVKPSSRTLLLVSICSIVVKMYLPHLANGEA